MYFLLILPCILSIKHMQTKKKSRTQEIFSVVPQVSKKPEYIHVEL